MNAPDRCRSEENQVTTKIRIRAGATEIDYEGPEDFFKAELPSLLDAVSKLHQEVGTHAPLDDNKPDSDSVKSAAASPTSSIGTTTSIATKLRCKTGTDLVLAAAARLTFGEAQSQFSRQTLLEEMQSAPAYYSENYRKGLSKSLLTLQKNSKINEVSTNNYALTAKASAELESKLAG